MHRIVCLVILGLALVPLGGYGATVHLVTGSSLSISVWQTLPRIYSDTAMWGGVGLDVALGIVTLGAAVTITDFETFTITTDPSFAVDASVAMARLGPLLANIGAGLMLQPSSGFTTVDAGVSVSYDPFRNTRVHVSMGVQTTLPWVDRQGTTVNIGMGISYLWPLL